MTRACILLLAMTGIAEAGEQSGIASTYGYGERGGVAGSRTACGDRLNSGALTAAHRTLRCGTKVTVLHQITRRTVTVVINDRGPFIKERIIDLSPAAARAIGLGYSVAPVQLRW